MWTGDTTPLHFDYDRFSVPSNHPTYLAPVTIFTYWVLVNQGDGTSLPCTAPPGGYPGSLSSYLSASALGTYPFSPATTTCACSSRPPAR